MKTKINFSVIASILLAFTVTGCNTLQTGSRAETDVDYDASKARIGSEMSRVNASVNKPSMVTSVKGKWIVGKSIPLAEESYLPPVFNQSWTFAFPGRVNIGTAAERIARITGVPVRVRPDAYMPLSSLTPSAAAAASTGEASIDSSGEVSLPGAPATAALSTSSVGDYSTNMELNYQGTLTGFLNHISARAAVSWEYKDGAIVIYRIVTKNFTLKASPGDASFSGSVGKTGKTEGGTNSQGGGTQNASTASFSSEATVKMSSAYSVWTSVDTAIKAMLSPIGKVSINQGTGTITVSDVKDVVDQVEAFINKENLTLNRQVRMRVEVLNVKLNKEYERGVDWNLVYTNLSRLLTPNFSLNLTSPGSLTGAQAGSVGFTISASGDRGGLDAFNGTNAMLKALNGVGKASIINTTNAVTTNRQPVPVALTNQVGYVAATEAASTAVGGVGGVPGLTPGTVTTGFILNLLPTVLDNGKVLLQFSVDMSELQRLNTVTSGAGDSQQSIQTPEVSSMQFLQRTSLRPGETLILSGFERRNNQYDKRSLTENGESFLGGSIAGDNQNEALVIMITSMIEDN